MPKPVFEFAMSCEQMEREDDLRELDKMIRDGREVTWRTFSKWVSVEQIRRMFPGYSYRREGEGIGYHLKDEQGVRFYRSKFWGERCYYLVHSSIEYIFVNLETFWQTRARARTLARMAKIRWQDKKVPYRQ